MYSILIVDDEKSVRYSFRKLLDTSSYELYEADNYDTALEVFGLHKPSLVIVDIEMPGKSGLELLKTIKEISPLTPVIVITAFGSGDRVIKAMKYGAYEYIEKPFEIPSLINLINEALRSVIQEPLPEKNTKRQLGERNTRASQVADKDIIIGESPAMKDVFKLIGRVAVSDASILVTGESGTGKEMVARAIHLYSDRAGKPFIAVNCAAIPEALLESELFGYEKGAFTGASKDKPGKFEEANGGTLLLDEIGDMGVALQSKLLRVLQEGTLDRLGGSKNIRVNVRIITATNQNLETLIQKKAFREDLYYRIRVVTIALPPLRMRKDDIPILVHHFLTKHAGEARIENISIHPSTMKKLMDYDWPGNIRELENSIKRALILAKGNIIIPELISIDPMITQEKQDAKISPIHSYLSDDIISREGNIFDLVSRSVEKDLICWALQKTAMNQAKAARLLGISRVMLHERMERFGIAGKS
jgi:DNA-binding NtrC family response regulator